MNDPNGTRLFYKLLIAFIGFSTLTQPVFAQCITPPSSMVSWWDGDDVSGQDVFDLQSTNDAVLQNGAAITSGYIGDAFEFDGTDDLLETDLTINFYSGGVTFDAWVKTEDDNGMILCDGGGTTGGRGMGLFVEAGKLHLYGTKGTAGIANFYLSSSQVIDDNDFHLVAATWNGTTQVDGVKLYLDGVEVASGTAQASISAGSTPIYAGAHATIGYNKFEGIVDEIEIFDRVLSAQEVLNLYDAGSSGKCKACITPPSDMISWWDADAILGTFVYDLQGNHDGALQNGATTTTGQVGDAFYFDGVDDYLQTPLTINFYADGVSFDAWVRTEDDNGMILCDGGGTTGGRGMGLFVEAGKLHLYGTKGTAGFENFHISSSQSIDDDDFHLIAATWTGTTQVDGVKLYLDGALVASGTALASISTGSVPIFAGSHSMIGYNKFEGMVDEIEIFSRVLTSNEILGLFESGSIGKCKNSTASKRSSDNSSAQETNETLVAVYPNPSKGVFMVSMTMMDNSLITVLNAQGSVVRETASANQGSLEIDISDLPKGIYFVKVTIDGEKEIVKRVVYH